MPREEALREAERADPFAPHDPGCRCWPHVSQRAAIEAATQAATAEYRESLHATPEPSVSVEAASFPLPLIPERAWAGGYAAGRASQETPPPPPPLDPFRLGMAMDMTDEEDAVLGVSEAHDD